MDEAFLNKVRALSAMGCSAGAIAHIAKCSKNKVNTALIAIRVINSEKRPTMDQLRQKQAAISAQMVLLKLDKAYEKKGAKVQADGKVRLREPA
jgi:hypothetical protein